MYEGFHTAVSTHQVLIAWILWLQGFNLLCNLRGISYHVGIKIGLVYVRTTLWLSLDQIVTHKTLPSLHHNLPHLEMFKFRETECGFRVLLSLDTFMYDVATEESCDMYCANLTGKYTDLRQILFERLL